MKNIKNFIVAALKKGIEKKKKKNCSETSENQESMLSWQRKEERLLKEEVGQHIEIPQRNLIR